MLYSNLNIISSNYSIIKYVIMIKMKTTLKIINVGNSIGIIIPSHIKKRLKLQVDDLVEIEIKKVNENSKKESC